jgi:hypothetical protein
VEWTRVPATPDSRPRLGVELPEGQRHALRVTLSGEDGRIIAAHSPRPRDGAATTAFTDLAPSAYTIDVTVQTDRKA